MLFGVIYRILPPTHVSTQDRLERKSLCRGILVFFLNTDLEGKKSLYNKNQVALQEKRCLELVERDWIVS